MLHSDLFFTTACNDFITSKVRDATSDRSKCRTGPTFFKEAFKLQITFKTRASISDLHFNGHEVTQEY